MPKKGHFKLVLVSFCWPENNVFPKNISSIPSAPFSDENFQYIRQIVSYYDTLPIQLKSS